MSLLQVVDLDKKFGGHYALHNVSLTVEAGEIHALVGENGAGKSTFIKIITGVYHQDSGKIIWQGKGIDITDPGIARHAGISVIHQERHLIPAFMGVENLFLGLDYPKIKFWPGVDWKAMRKSAERAMDELGIKIPLDIPAQYMTPVERTLLEILRAMMLECKLLILDEPTASLTDKETEILFQLINRLKAKKTAIIYVSHRLEEIFKLADRITVLRNGNVAGTVQCAEVDRNGLISLMTDGSAMKLSKRERVDVSNNPILLDVKDISTFDHKVKNVSFHIRQKEVVGLFGLAGAGRTELLEAIYGLRNHSNGEITIKGKNTAVSSPNNSLKSGMVLIPEDRRSHGAIMNMTIRENMTLPILSNYTDAGVIRSEKERQDVYRQMNSLNVKSAGLEQKVSELSGGNQQKVVFAKAMMSHPSVFLCDEPTQAVDIMTRDEIHRLLWAQADSGHGVLFVSSDLQEVLEVSDRVLVMHDGKIIANISADGLKSEQVLKLCYSKGKKGEFSNDVTNG